MLVPARNSVHMRTSSALSIMLLALLCLASQAQIVDGGAMGAAMPAAVPAMTLRGGADAAAGEAEAAQVYMNEQLEYWNSLTKEQQEELLSKMSPEERANAEGSGVFVLLTDVLMCRVLFKELTARIASIRLRQAAVYDYHRGISQVSPTPLCTIALSESETTPVGCKQTPCSDGVPLIMCMLVPHHAGHGWR